MFTCMFSCSMWLSHFSKRNFWKLENDGERKSKVITLVIEPILISSGPGLLLSFIIDLPIIKIWVFNSLRFKIGIFKSAENEDEIVLTAKPNTQTSNKTTFSHQQIKT